MREIAASQEEPAKKREIVFSAVEKYTCAYMRKVALTVLGLSNARTTYIGPAIYSV